MDGLLEPPSDARRCHPIICSKNEITFPNTLVEAVVMGKLFKPLMVLPLQKKFSGSVIGEVISSTGIRARTTLTYEGEFQGCSF